MRYLYLLFGFLVSLPALAQALQDINYNYLYNPNEKFSFQMKSVRSSQGWVLLTELRLKDKADQTGRYSIQFEKRDALNSKEGVVLQNDSLTKITLSTTREGTVAQITFDKANVPKIIVAKIVDTTVKRAWLFYEYLLPANPVNNYLIDSGGQAVIEPYVLYDNPYSIKNSTDAQSWIASYYEDDFPAAAPAFSEGQARVPSVMKVDSTISLSAENPITFSKVGLYLVQKDTSSGEGFAFRVYDDYPKFSKLENLVDPLIYVSTKQETERLKEARGDKKAFDRVILGITGNTDRARIFMKSYFQRVEQANLHFASYKEGWKTDRGMIFIIFGMPDELYRFTDREVWTYKNELYKATFDFVRSPTLFDPDNYVLIRDKKYQETWYQVIDLWRNARL